MSRIIAYEEKAQIAADNQLYMYHPNNKGWIRCSKILIKNIKDYI